MMVNISGLDKKQVLMELFNNSVGSLFFGPMSYEMAQEQFAENGDLYFDYVMGIPIKADLTGDTIDLSYYERDNGSVVTEAVVRKLEQKLKNN